MIEQLILMVIAYFLGAIPFALLVSRLKHVDLTKIGSGNLGATNVYRAMGLKWAALVFALDALKGCMPVVTAMLLWEYAYAWHIGIGALAIVGHSLSPFVKFKGGKGAATGLGVLLALNWFVFALLALLAVVMIGFLRIVSLTTIVCAILAPILLWYFQSPPVYTIFVTVISIFIIVRHKANIVRLLRGTENKV